MDARIIGSLAYIRTRTEHQNHKELELNEREAALNEREHGDQPEELGQCPFEGCAKVLGTMSKLSLATHFATHSGAGVTFKCPLDGCDHWRPLPLNMANGGQQLKEHYKHNDEDVQGEQSAQNSVLTTKSAKKRNGGKVLFVAQQTEHGNTHPAASNPSELPAEDSKSKSNEVDGSSLQISTQQTPSLKQSSIAKPSPIRRMQTPSKVVPMSPNAKDSATSGLVDSTLL